MLKQRVAEKLQEHGYNAFVDDAGIVMIKTDKPLTLRQTGKLEKFLKSIDYRASWGWKVCKEEQVDG